MRTGNVRRASLAVVAAVATLATLAAAAPGPARAGDAFAVSVGASRAGWHYRPFVRPYSGWGVGWGWPYHGGWWWAPYYDGYYARPTVVLAQPPPAIGTLELGVRPKKAALRVDGVDYGRARDYDGAWALLYLSPGEHELEFSRDGFRTLRRTMDVRAGEFYRIRENLAKGEGLDPRSDPPRAFVEPGSARSAVTRGLLRIEAWPDDAAVYLDDEFLAQASELRRLHGALPVAPGLHRVEVVRPGYRSRTQEVQVDPDRPSSVDIRLEAP